MRGMGPLGYGEVVFFFKGSPVANIYEMIEKSHIV